MTTEPVGIRGAGRSVLTYRVGGREYPLKTVRSCRTCMSPWRFEIEQFIIGGRVYRKIHEEIALLAEEAGLEAPSIRSIQDHYYNGHMPVEQAETRAIIEDRAMRVGKRIEDSNEGLVDGITLMQTVVQKTFQDIASGKIEPGVRDGLAAAKLLAEMGEYDGENVDQQQFVEAFMAYHETAERVMGTEMFRAFGDALADNPVLKALAARYDGEEPDTVPGEVTETYLDPDPETEGSGGDS